MSNAKTVKPVPSDDKARRMLQEVTDAVNVKQSVWIVDAEPGSFIWTSEKGTHERAPKSVTAEQRATWNGYELVVKRARPPAEKGQRIFERHVFYEGYLDEEMVLADVSRMRARTRLEVHAFRAYHKLPKLD